MKVCVDASLVVKWLTNEKDSDRAITWLESHAEDELIAPIFLSAEVSSVLRRKTRQGWLTAQQAREALQLLERLRLRLVWDWSMAERAMMMAEELDQPTTYDTFYLAVAEKEECEFWTADERFVRGSSGRYPFVRLLM